MEQQHDQLELASLAEDLPRYFERLVLLYLLALKAFALRHTGSLHDAEEIAQEALIRAYYALERYPVERRRMLKARPWLYKITWNMYCNYTRRDKPPEALSLEAESGAWREPENAPEEQPERAFESAEQRQELEALVATLPPRYRTVVSLYYFEDLSYQEIADLLQQPLGTVKGTLHRSIRLLRKALGQEPAGEEERHAGR